MKLNIQKPRNFINPLLSRKSVDESAFNSFKAHFQGYKLKFEEQIKSKQTEPNIVTNALKPFMDSFGYKAENYSQKGQISIDLALMQSITPTVIIEAKMPNSNDMITENDLNKKSFHQAILYFMNERERNNKELYHIVITDFNNWFVFDAKDFDRLFWNNKRIRKYHEALIKETLLGDRTEDFYRDISKELPTLKRDLFEPELIDCAHFNIQLKSNEKELTAIYKLLSADCLIKKFNPNDANSLNKEFYNELLYILGLEETKDGGKKVIGRAKNYQSGTLYENISNKLGQYQKNNDFESVIKLIIIWVNRILFLKLLESQIVKWSGVPKFLDPKELNQYDQLETLFFDVLAKPIKLRSVSEYKHVPYLNSSLFEIHPDEKVGITIANMADDLEINYYSKTVLKSNKNESGKISTLPYLLAFLDAYDFANDSDEELTNTSKTLISASVLGLIFEKINGYKDGSFYTPSFITMHMARETIEKTVIAKFNQAKSWQCKSLKDVINKDYEIAEANAIINDIKICDPAVGSGHFLVSALNELLRIKSDLGVLVDDDDKRIKDYTLSIENDELIIMSDDGEQFQYKKGSTDKTRIQKTLFKEKQILIENCLFGVDINPNSVNICRLRLWVELLKNAYYKDDGELDTLPNIDINIKCGNSLISRFALTDDLNSKTIKAEIQDYKDKVKQYKENIGSKQGVLLAIESMKIKFQHTLKSTHSATNKLNFTLTEYISKHGFDGLSSNQKLKALDDLKLLGKQDSLFGDADDPLEKTKSKKAVDAAWSAVIEIESGKIYESAFEWRFEFPEVLNDAGEFVGFDVIIGNPPYIKEDKNKSAFDGLHKHPCYQGKTDIWHMFTGQALDVVKQNGLVSFIAKNQWMESQSSSNMRRVIYEKSDIKSIIDFGTNMVFDEAGQQTMIFLLEKTTENTTHEIAYKKIISKLDNNQIAKLIDNNAENEQLRLIHKSIVKNYDEFANLTFSDSTQEKLLLKIEALRNFEFNEATEIAQGIIGGPDKAFIIKRDDVEKFSESEKIFIKMLHTNSERWSTPDNIDYIFYISAKNFTDKQIEDYPNIQQHFTPYKAELQKAKTAYKTSKKLYFYLHREREERFFVGGQRLVWAKRTDGSKFTVTEAPLYGTANLFFVKTERINLKYLAALLNSKLMYFYMHQRLKHTGDLLQIDKNQFIKIPVFVPELSQVKAIEQKVDIILKTKNSGQDISQLEEELDNMVYALYSLSIEEIETIKL
jgi:adenine-specific DNA-methyltransferase